MAKVNADTERLVLIMWYLYFKQAELVFSYDDDEGAYELFFEGRHHYYGQLLWRDCEYLIETGIVEFDSGCEDGDYETRTKVYTLSADSMQRIARIIKDASVRKNSQNK